PVVADCRILHPRVAVDTLIIIVRLYVGVVPGIVVIGVVVVGVVRVVIPRKKPLIEPEPESVVKDEEAMVEEVCMSPVPIVVPICCALALGDMVRSAIERRPLGWISWTSCWITCSTRCAMG